MVWSTLCPGMLCASLMFKSILRKILRIKAILRRNIILRISIFVNSKILILRIFLRKMAILRKFLRIRLILSKIKNLGEYKPRAYIQKILGILFLLELHLEFSYS